jgi:cyanophycin synthetase
MNLDAPRQPLRQHPLQLRCPERIDLQRIDDWLVNALDIAPPSAEESPAPGIPADLPGLLRRCLLINAAYLRHGNVPAFEPGEILRIDPTSDALTWRVVVGTAHVDQLPAQCFSLALEHALQTALWFNKTERNESTTEQLYRMIDQRIRQPLHQSVPAGKSTIPVLTAAHRRGIPFIHLGAGVYQLGWGSKARKLDRSATDGDSALGCRLAQNKVLSAQLLRSACLPAPDHGIARDAGEARQTALRLGWPVVVKPADRDRGEGVSVGISGESALDAAFTAAYGLSQSGQVIVERQVPGVCHRLFIAFGRLLYAVKRLPKSVEGDGRHTVRQLIEAVNRREADLPPWLRTEPYPDDAAADAAMAAAGFAPDAIPAAGQWIPLRAIESTADGGHDEEVGHLVHPDNLDIALRATRLFGLEVAGIDIITPDIGVPWHANGAIINEVNYSPLLGGAEISRSHLPEFLDRLLGGDGRIPVEVYVGDEAALRAAEERQRELAAGGCAAYLTSHRLSRAPDGREMAMPFTGLARRSQALLLDRRVEAIVVVAQTSELLHIGGPIDRIVRLEIINDRISAPEGDVQAAPRLVRLLRSRLTEQNPGVTAAGNRSA